VHLGGHLYMSLLYHDAKRYITCFLIDGEKCEFDPTKPITVFGNMWSRKVYYENIVSGVVAVFGRHLDDGKTWTFFKNGVAELREYVELRKDGKVTSPEAGRKVGMKWHG